MISRFFRPARPTLPTPQNTEPSDARSSRDYDMRVEVVHRLAPEALDLVTASITSKLEQIMANLDQVLDLVRAENSDIQSISVLIKGLRQQIADATSGVLPADIQAKVDAVFNAVEANKAAIADAVQARPVPVEPAPVVDAAPAADVAVPADPVPATEPSPS